MRIIYEDENVKVFDKPAGVNCDDFEKRAHRLDKDTSGVFLVAKNNQSLEFLQKQFKERKVEKKYLVLVVGNLKNSQGKIATFLGRSPKDKRKQKAYLALDPKAQGKREAITEYKILEKFKDFILCEVRPRTGRKHQIRAHFAYLGHPVAGDKLYRFRNQPCPEKLERQFLHSSYLKIKLPSGQIKEFHSELPLDLKLCLQKLKPLSKAN